MKPTTAPVLSFFPPSSFFPVLYQRVIAFVLVQILFTSQTLLVHSLVPNNSNRSPSYRSHHYHRYHHPTDTRISHSNSESSRPTLKNIFVASRPDTKLNLLPELDGEPFLTIANSYTSALEEQPFITKACTGFFLCGSGDVLAQFRARGTKELIDSFEPELPSTLEPTSSSSFDYARLLRFASKGFFGTLLWAFWYDISDELIREESILSTLQSISIQNPSEFTVNTARTVALILAEQFVTCPLIYGLWEIPVSTLLNGASPKKIPYEVQSKIVPMLIDNAKIWTWANLVIYNVPLQYRAICGNIMDILWQSIVADYAADCGKDECLLVEGKELRKSNTNVNSDDTDSNMKDMIQIPIKKNGSADSNKEVFRKKKFRTETTNVVQ